MNKAMPNKKRNFYPVLLLILAISFVLWWNVPALSKGTDNLNMIKHFDMDEGNVVEFFSLFYKNPQSLLCPPVDVGYPTGFYYVAGAYLFPYSLLHKADNNYQVVAITLRFFNTVFVCLTVVLIYCLACYFLIPMVFKIALLLLLFFTPNFLVWGLNNRPHPFENALLMISFCFIFSWLRNKKTKNLIIAILIAAIAFGVKYGGMFMIPALFTMLMYYFYGLDRARLYQFINKRSKIITFLSSGAVIIGLGVILFLNYAAMPYVLRYTRIGSTIGIEGLTHSPIFKYSSFCLITMILLNLLWFCSNIYTRIILKQKKLVLNQLQNFALFVNLAFISLFSVLMAFLVVFILTNPHVLAHPLQFLKSSFNFSFIEFAPKSQSNSYIAQQSIWFKLLFEKHMLGLSGGIMLVWYFFFELFYFKKEWREERVLAKQRIFFWIYILTNFLFLFLFTKFHVHHYLLMITYVCLILIIYGIYKTILFENNRISKTLFIILFSVLLCWNLAEKAPEVFNSRDFKMNKEADTGLMIGRWLENQYSSNVKIWVDTNEFYIPPKFSNRSSMHWYDDIESNFDKIEKMSPDVLVITSPYDLSLKHAQKIESATKTGILSGFKLQGEFRYHGPLAKAGWYSKIFVYEKRQ